jgi:hypothetical protein
MSTTEENSSLSVGQETSTKSVSEEAMKLHAKYRLARGLVNDMSFQELTGDNAENYFLIKFCRWCSTALILKPRKKKRRMQVLLAFLLTQFVITLDR